MHNVLNTKEYIERFKEELQNELNKVIKGQYLYNSDKGKLRSRGKIITCRVKCFKEYLGHNTTVVEIKTDDNGRTLWTTTIAECLYDQNEGFDYAVLKEEQ